MMKYAADHEWLTLVQPALLQPGPQSGGRRLVPFTARADGQHCIHRDRTDPHRRPLQANPKRSVTHDRHQAVLTARSRRRAVGAGAKHKLVFVDRLLTTLFHLRHGPTRDVLACWFASTAPASRAQSAKYGHCWRCAAAPSHPTSASGHLPKSSTISVRAGRPGSWPTPDTRAWEPRRADVW
ncbi:transposase family protein [Streptomyces sp. NPDC000618]|uniref:helix-turn-helix domain-containing protein n=1 Tax=Streptomyces sp. NPDC000618 TaxID=3154265 RepID=UPI00332D8AFB